MRMGAARIPAMVAAVATGLAILSAPLRAQTWPAQPIRLVVPFPAGGGADTLARIVTKFMGDTLGQGFIILNVPGAGGALGFEQVARATPDGHSLIWTSVAFPVMAATIKSLKFDPAKDFVHVAQVGQNPLVLVVNPAVPANSLAELIALAKAKPGSINFAHNGSGTLTNLVVEQLRLGAGVEVVQVAYRGDNFSIADVMGGHVQAMFSNSPVSLPHVANGKLKALAVTSPRRSAAVPDLPTMIEAGLPGFEAVVWQGITAPAGTPRAILDKLTEALKAALVVPEVARRFADLGSEPVGSGPDEFGAFVARELIAWADVVRRSGVKVE